MTNKRLDLSKLRYSDKVTTYEDALKGKNVLDLDETQSMVVKKAKIDEEKKCVKLEISY